MIWLLIYITGYFALFGTLMGFILCLDVAEREDIEREDFGIVALLALLSWLGYFAWLIFAFIGVWKKHQIKKTHPHDS